MTAPTRSTGRSLALAAMLGTVALVALAPFASTAGASGPSHPTKLRVTATAVRLPPHVIPIAYPPYTAYDAGTPYSRYNVFNKSGQLVAYGDPFVSYVLPQLLQGGTAQSHRSAKVLYFLGEALYQANCQACHGVLANGVPARRTPGQPGGFPSLEYIGPATIDFWIESGRMPATATNETQPIRRPARLDHLQAIAIETYLNTRWPATPYIPQVNLTGANLADGATLFALNCAACHTITGDGDALANDTFAPSMRDVPVAQVAEAMRTGPANMPIFTGNMTDQQLRDVVAYVVDKIQHPQNPGGLGLGGLGPVGEGFIGLALGVGLLALVGFWIGDRS